MAFPVSISLPDSHRFLDSLPKVARHLGMSLKTLERWASQGVIKTNKRGKWSTQSVAGIAVKRNRELEERRVCRVDGKRALDELNHQLKMIRIQREELALKAEESVLISKPEVERSFIRQVMSLKRTFMPLGEELASHLVNQEDPRKVQQVIDEAVKKRIRFLSGQISEEDEAAIQD